MRVLGVDPGVARTGVAVVDGAAGRLRLISAACVDTPADEAEPIRLAQLFGAIDALLAEQRPEVVAVEQLFFGANRRSALRVSQARGVVLCAAARARLPVVEYTPMQVKEAVAGWGAAAKPQVARMTCRLLGVDAVDGPDDVTDACAVAVCHHHRSRLAAALPGARPSGQAALAAAVARARSRGAARA